MATLTIIGLSVLDLKIRLLTCGPDPFANNDDIFGEPKEKTSVSKKSHKPQEKIHVREC
jgi:hypothetical protein